MERNKWRELCARTPSGNSGPARLFHQSTDFRYVKLPDGREVWIKGKGKTYRKA